MAWTWRKMGDVLVRSYCVPSLVHLSILATRLHTSQHSKRHSQVILEDPQQSICFCKKEDWLIIHGEKTGDWDASNIKIPISWVQYALRIIYDKQATTNIFYDSKIIWAFAGRIIRSLASETWKLNRNVVFLGKDGRSSVFGWCPRNVNAPQPLWLSSFLPLYMGGKFLCSYECHRSCINSPRFTCE